MRPWDAEGFEWDEANESELADPRHLIQPWEVEQVFWSGPVWVPNIGFPTEGVGAATTKWLAGPTVEESSP